MQAGGRQATARLRELVAASDGTRRGGGGRGGDKRRLSACGCGIEGLVVRGGARACGEVGLDGEGLWWRGG